MKRMKYIEHAFRLPYYVIRLVSFFLMMVVLYVLIGFGAIIVLSYEAIKKVIYKHNVLLAGHNRHNLEKINWLEKNIRFGFWWAQEQYTSPDSTLAEQYLKTIFYFIYEEDAILFKLTWYSKDDE